MGRERASREGNREVAWALGWEKEEGTFPAAGAGAAERAQLDHQLDGARGQ